MSVKFRCDCTITSAIDVLGDRWMLVIIKQMLIQEAETFKDFLEQDEAVATNILSSKLKLLEELKLITKSKASNNKKTNYYHLTERSLALTPTIVELAIWGDAHLRELNPLIGDQEELEYIRNNKESYCQSLVENYKEKLAKRKSEGIINIK